jgi:hypothetical protein
VSDCGNSFVVLCRKCGSRACPNGFPWMKLKSTSCLATVLVPVGKNHKDDNMSLRYIILFSLLVFVISYLSANALKRLLADA